MGTDTESITAGADLIVRNFLQQLGLHAAETRLTVTDKLLIANVRGFLTPAERELLQHGTGVESLYQLRDELFRSLEHVLRERVENFLGKSVKKIHTVYGLQGDEMDIIILFE
jgi:uncharacterized protein YbcI